MKTGFSLIMGIIFIVLVATLGMLSLNYSTQAVKQGANLFLKEQAELYAMSAIERAVYDMQRTNYNGGECIRATTYNYDGFTATVRFFYLDGSLNSCDGDRSNTPSGYNALYGGSDNTAIIDVIVTANAGEPIRYHRRTVQRP